MAREVTQGHQAQSIIKRCGRVCCTISSEEIQLLRTLDLQIRLANKKSFGDTSEAHWRPEIPMVSLATRCLWFVPRRFCVFSFAIYKFDSRDDAGIILSIRCICKPFLHVHFCIERCTGYDDYNRGGSYSGGGGGGYDRY